MLNRKLDFHGIKLNYRVSLLTGSQPLPAYEKSKQGVFWHRSTELVFPDISGSCIYASAWLFSPWYETWFVIFPFNWFFFWIDLDLFIWYFTIFSFGNIFFRKTTGVFLFLFSKGSCLLSLHAKCCHLKHTQKIFWWQRALSRLQILALLEKFRHVHLLLIMCLLVGENGHSLLLLQCKISFCSSNIWHCRYRAPEVLLQSSLYDSAVGEWIII